MKTLGISAPEPEPDPKDLIRQARRMRWMVWLSLGFSLVFLGALLVWLIPPAVRYWAASVPAVLGAAIGYARARRRTAAWPDLSHGGNELSETQQLATLWGGLFGAVGYAALATLGIGVPAPEAPLGWRIAGGVIFGAAAGVAAGVLTPCIDLVAFYWRRMGAV